MRSELREALARYLFERSPNLPGSSPEDAPWEEWVERNQEQWREEADALLDFLREARTVRAK